LYREIGRYLHGIFSSYIVTMNIAIPPLGKCFLTVIVESQAASPRLIDQPGREMYLVNYSVAVRLPLCR
jgi:hypothetical protein